MNEAEELAAYRKAFGPLPEAPATAPKGTTHVLFVTDMSGSMSPLADDVRGGFNTYIADLAAKPGNFRLSVTVFDTEFIALCVDTPLAAVPKLDRRNYQPRGGTALFEAVGRTVTGFEERVPDLHPDDRVLVVIQTDGAENSSAVEWRDPGTVAALIKARELGGQWSFIYLGAGVDTWAQARSMGVSRDSYVNVAATSEGTAGTYSGLTHASVAFAAGASGAEASRILSATSGVVDQP
jgi:hypothetical protein